VNLRTIARLALAVFAAGVWVAAASGTNTIGRNGRLLVSSGEGLLLVQPTGGGVPAKLPGTRGGDTSTAWSPGGDRIAYQGAGSQIYAIDPDGGRRRQLTFTDDFNGDPSWAPSDQRIVFESARGSTYDLWTMRGDGRAQTRVTTSPGRHTDPDWGRR